LNTIITNKNEIINTTLKITFREDISQDLGNVLPYPNKHYIADYIVYYYYIEGFFGTKDSINYINDIKSRFLITYKDKIKEIKHYNNIDKVDYLHKLKHFQNLKSRTIQIINQNNRYDNKEDFRFWVLKLFAEDSIREKSLITYQELLDFGLLNDLECQKNSLKSKCRSIVNYYINNDYKIYTKYKRKTKNNKELKMTRQENQKQMVEKIKQDNIKKVKNFLTGMFAAEYKKKEKWNISKISKELKMSRTTLTKIIKEENL
jgi:AraC-like DNA-binding protein